MTPTMIIISLCIDLCIYIYIYIFIHIYLYIYNVSMPCMFSLIFLRPTVATIRSLQVAWGELCEAGLTELMTRLLVPSFSEAAMDRPFFFVRKILVG